MQTATINFRRSCSIFLVLILVASSLASCSKQRANMTLNKAKSRLERAKNLDAARFQPSLLSQVESKVSSAESQMSSEDFSTALQTSKDALNQATDLLEQTRQEGANVLLQEAEQNLDVANINKGSQINPELFQTIENNVKEAARLKNEEKYEESMEVSKQVAIDVEKLLSGQKEQAEKDQRDAIAKFDTLIRVERGRDEAPIQVSSIEKKIDEQADLINRRDYISARQVYLEIIALVNEGITEARRSRSQKWINVIGDKVIEAVNEGAEIYMPELLSSVESRQEKLLKDFRDEYYPLVLESAELLDADVDNLTQETRIAAAKDYMGRVRKAIRNLQNDDVESYLPGRLGKISSKLQQAEQEFENDFWQDCKKTCIVALEDAAALVKDFRAKANSEIQSAGDRLDQAQNTLETMKSIFDVDSPEVTDEVDKRFEETKKSLQSQLESNIQSANILLASAKVKSEGEEFSTAIENARSVKKRADYIIHEIYHVVAHNNAQALSQRLAGLAANGGKNYSPEQLENAKAALQAAREEIRRVEEQTGNLEGDVPEVDPNAYRKAVQMTADVRAESEVLVLTIESDVREQISAARNMIDVAEQNQAETHTIGALTTARQVVQKAEEQLAAGSYSDAGSSAKQAKMIAAKAAKDSIRIWAGQELESAKAAIDEVEQANAMMYAPRRAQVASNKMQTAVELFERSSTLSGDMQEINALQEARDLAVQARRDANGALMKPVTDANEKITTAKRFGAWEYDHPTVLNAILNAKMALAAMENDNYDQARAYARQAQVLAESVSDETKEYKYSVRMEKARRNLQNQLDSGSRYFTVDEVRKLAVELQLMRRDYSVERYETISAALDQFESELFELSKKTPQIFQQMVEDQRELYELLVERRARQFAGTTMTRADRQLRYAVIDFNKGEYAMAYSNLKLATEGLASVYQVFEEQIFAQKVRDIFNEFDRNMDHVRILVRTAPGGFKWIYGKRESERYNAAVLRGTDPAAFRAAMSNTLKKARAIKYPESMERTYKDMVECVSLGHDSSVAFEKFIILNHYDPETAREIINTAYTTLRKSRDMREDIMERFEIKGLQVPVLTDQQLSGLQ